MKSFRILLAASTLALLSCGAGETPTDSSADCSTDNLSFKTDIWPIFEANCMGCHSEEEYARKADGNKMTNYDEIKAQLDAGLVIGNIEHAKGFIKMPYKKAQIAQCDIDKIKAWAAAGAPNN